MGDGDDDDSIDHGNDIDDDDDDVKDEGDEDLLIPRVLVLSTVIIPTLVTLILLTAMSSDVVRC